jgi:transcriptional regulator with PAS, ATPase and Fis domain
MVRGVIDNQLGTDYAWPGNVRELEQCVRRVLLNRSYSGDRLITDTDLPAHLSGALANGEIDAQSLLSGYCFSLYQKYRTFESVARRVKLDRRTVKKYIDEWEKKNRGI